MSGPVTHRLEFTVGVVAASEARALDIAQEIYERFAAQMAEVEGVKWMLPVATARAVERSVRAALSKPETPVSGGGGHG